MIWPAERVRILLQALDFCIDRLKPHLAKNPLIKYRSEQYAYVRKLIVAARPPKTGVIRIRIDKRAAALIRPAVVSYIAELKKRAKAVKRR